jgi:hypothetical protein
MLPGNRKSEFARLADSVSRIISEQPSVKTAVPGGLPTRPATTLADAKPTTDLEQLLNQLPQAQAGLPGSENPQLFEPPSSTVDGQWVGWLLSLFYDFSGPAYNSPIDLDVEFPELDIQIPVIHQGNGIGPATLGFLLSLWGEPADAALDMIIDYYFNFPPDAEDLAQLLGIGTDIGDGSGGGTIDPNDILSSYYNLTLEYVSELTDNFGNPVPGFNGPQWVLMGVAGGVGDPGEPGEYDVPLPIALWNSDSDSPEGLWTMINNQPSLGFESVLYEPEVQ